MLAAVAANAACCPELLVARLDLSGPAATSLGTALSVKKVRTALDALGVATGPAAAVPTTRADGGGYVWIDLSEFCGGSFEGETRLWEELAITYRVLIVPGGLCGAARPGYFRAAVAGTEEALEKGLERLELGVRAANDTGCG